MIWQHKMTPKSPDPQAQQQQKIMMIMTPVLALMLYGMPSGLMVYFLCSTLFGMAEQQFIRKRMDAAAAAVIGEQSAIPVDQKRQKPTPQRRKRHERK